MKIRLVLAGVAALLLTLALAPAAMAAVTRDASATVNSMPGAVWALKLRGFSGKPTLVWSSKTYAAWEGKQTKQTYTDSSTNEVFSGVVLRDIVGRIDGGSKTGFNTALALANGYVVRVAGVDGFYCDFPSMTVATNDIIVADSYTSPTVTTAMPLPFGTAKYKTTGNVASFSPSWPLKLVGSTLSSGKQKIGGINYITLIKAKTAGAKAVARDASASVSSMKDAVWAIRLRGFGGKPNLVWTSKTYKAWESRLDGESYTDTTTKEVFAGVALRDIVGRIDGGSKAAFNMDLALNNGYVVRVAGADGFYYDFQSADVATDDIIVADRYVAPYAASDTPLPYGTAKYKTSGNVASFSPTWPLKMVGSTLTSGKQKIGGVNYITLIKAKTAR